MKIAVIGYSGSGKSTSMRNFNENEVGIFNVASKPLPFRKKLPKLNNAGYKQIIAGLSKPKLKTYVIDDSQYLMAFQMFDKAKETGYNKFTDIALDFRNLIQLTKYLSMGRAKWASLHSQGYHLLSEKGNRLPGKERERKKRATIK